MLGIFYDGLVTRRLPAGESDAVFNESNQQSRPVRHRLSAASRRLALYSISIGETGSRRTQPIVAESRTVAGKAAGVRVHCVAGLALRKAKKAVGGLRDLHDDCSVECALVCDSLLKLQVSSDQAA